MKSTLFSKSLLLAGTALVLGSSTATYATLAVPAAGVQKVGSWTTVPGSACFAEDRANVSSFAAPGNAGIMLKTGEAAQWVVCPLARGGTIGPDGNGTPIAPDLNAGFSVNVVLDKAVASTKLYCYSSLLESDGKSGVWSELKEYDSGGTPKYKDLGAETETKTGIVQLTANNVGLSKPVDPGTFTPAVTNDEPKEGYKGALGIACLLSPGDKVISITAVVDVSPMVE